METLIVLIFKELAKPEKPIAKNCKICRKWGGCPPGREVSWTSTQRLAQGARLKNRRCSPQMLLNPG